MSDRPPAQHLHPDALPREGEDRFRVAFEVAVIGLAIVEPDGRIRAVNRSLRAMLGYQEAELLAVRLQDVTHPDDAPAIAGAWARLLAGETGNVQVEMRYLHKLGRVVWAVSTVALARDAGGAPAYFVSQLTDVTARRAPDETLTRRAAELERSSREFDEFAYFASHDLQAPLRTLRAYARLFAESYGGRLDPRADRWIGYIIGGADRMQRLVDDLLALARVRTDGGSLEPTDCANVVARAWVLLNEEALRSDARLTVGPLPTLRADGAQLERLFYHLFHNAAKYARPGVAIAVDVSAVRQRGEGEPVWRFAVRDNGIGVDPADAERIFELFQRGRHSSEHAGTGIGLSMCKRIVERHGGRIWAAPTSGDGATFVFTLPERGA